jgi:hypothetical protein
LEAFYALGEQFRAIIPQVYLHYDPYALRELPSPIRRVLGEMPIFARAKLDELVVLRYLWREGEASFDQLYGVLQCGKEFARRILGSMESKTMIESNGATYRLSASVRLDINLDLFGAA